MDNPDVDINTNIWYFKAHGSHSWAPLVPKGNNKLKSCKRI